MTTFTTRAERGVGIIEVDGSLNNAAVAGLRAAFAQATAEAGARHVLIVADKIISMDQSAAFVMVDECNALRAQGGKTAWVSRNGWTPTRGNVASTALVMEVYPTVESALDAFHIHTEGTP